MLQALICTDRAHALEHIPALSIHNIYGEQLVKNEGYLGGHRCRAGRIRTEEKKQSALDLCGSAMMDKWRAWDDKMLNECSFSNLGKSTTIQDSFSDELGCQVEHKLCPGVATRLYCQPDSA